MSRDNIRDTLSFLSNLAILLNFAQFQSENCLIFANFLAEIAEKIMNCDIKSQHF